MDDGVEDQDSVGAGEGGYFGEPGAVGIVLGVGEGDL